MITKITYIIIAQNRLRNPKIFRNTDKINNAKSCLRNCAYLVPTTGPRGQYLGKIHKEKAFENVCAIAGTEACYSTQGDSAPVCKMRDDR